MLDVNFDGINRAGDNEQAITETKAIWVAEMNALFGTWQGTFNYNVSIDDTEDAKWRDAVEFTLSSNNRAAIGYTGEENEELVIPAHFIGDGNNGTVEGQKYKTTISTIAFQKCTNLKSVTISEGITSIGPNAFNGCTNLTSVTLPSSLTSMDYRVFYDCENLTDITLPDGLTSIGNRAFSGCNNLTTINIPSGVTSIGEEVFYYCYSLTDVTIPDSIISLPNKLFAYCYDLTSVTISKSLTSIDNSVFESCTSLKDVNYCGTRAEWNAITKGSSWNTTGSPPPHHPLPRRRYLNPQHMQSQKPPRGAFSFARRSFSFILHKILNLHRSFKMW